MTHPAISQLLLAKSLYLRGLDVLRSDDELSRGVAISLFHDAAEMLMWDVVQKRAIKASERETFPELLRKMKDTDTRSDKSPAIPDAMMHDLNKARVAYKHN